MRELLGRLRSVGSFLKKSVVSLMKGHYERIETIANVFRNTFRGMAVVRDFCGLHVLYVSFYVVDVRVSAGSRFLDGV